MEFKKYLKESIEPNAMISYNMAGTGGFNGNVFMYEYKASESMGKILNLVKDGTIKKMPVGDGFYMWKLDGTLFICETADDLYTRVLK